MHTLVNTEYSVCELVRSPTLCGSPTLMLKLGLAACSTLTLGWVCRWGTSFAVGWTGGGTLGPRDTGTVSSSSSRFTESIIVLMDEVEAADGG
jgi:hypothetical protein